MYYMNDAGERVYTLKVRVRPCFATQGEWGGWQPAAWGAPPSSRCAAARAQNETPASKPTESAHPGARPPAPSPSRPNQPTPTLPPSARFSPDDKFSKHRLICKKRFGLLPTQNPQKAL